MKSLEIIGSHKSDGGMEVACVLFKQAKLQKKKRKKHKGIFKDRDEFSCLFYANVFLI